MTSQNGCNIVNSVDGSLSRLVTFFSVGFCHALSQVGSGPHVKSERQNTLLLPDIVKPAKQLYCTTLPTTVPLRPTCSAFSTSGGNGHGSPVNTQHRCECLMHDATRNCQISFKLDAKGM